MGHTSSLADPDIWMHHGEHYYEYIFVKGSIDKPFIYLGAIIKEHYLQDNPSKCVWSMRAEFYLKDAVSNIELQLLKLGKQLSNKIVTPLFSYFHSELDLFPFLDVVFLDATNPVVNE